MYHIFFIHSSVDGHLGCFHVSAVIVNSVTVNIGVYVSFQVMCFSRYMGLLDHTVILFDLSDLIFKSFILITTLLCLDPVYECMLVTGLNLSWRC